MNFRTSQNKRFTRWLSLALCLAVSLLSTPAAGAHRSWIGGSGYWSDAGNWDGLPLDGDSASLIHNMGDHRTVWYGPALYPGFTGTLSELSIDAPSGGSMTFNQGYGGYALPLLSTGSEQVGFWGKGTHIQSLGANTIGGILYLGVAAGSSGAYILSGSGSLSAKYQFLGTNGAGAFTQSGGANTVRTDLYLGIHDGSSGAYTLSGGANTVGDHLFVGYEAGSSGAYTLSGSGSLSSQTQYIGCWGTGAFIHSGGANTVSVTLGVGCNPGGSGTYTLSGTGSLSARVIGIGSLGGAGTFTQTGGSNTVTDGGRLNVGYVSSIGPPGTYNLEGGELSAPEVLVGAEGYGIFNHSGGDNRVNSTLYLGYLAGKSGVYNLSGSGSLSAPIQYIGYSGTGVFTQSGGDNMENCEIIIAANPGSSGAYNLQGGNLLVGTITVNPNGIFHQTGGTLQTGGLTNSGTITLGGGSADITDAVTNQAGGQLNLGAGGAANFTGPVTNYGAVRTTNANVTWAGTFTNSGAYISDPSTQTFTDLIITSSGYLQGGVGDIWSIIGNLQNQSTQNTLWNTALSDLAFTGGGTHQLFLPGADLGLAGYTDNFAWGSLDLTGQLLNLVDGNLDTPGGALYVRSLLGAVISGDDIANIFGNGLNLYYDPAAAGNIYLGGLTYDLQGGGHLNPVPLPGAAWLLLSGLAGLGLLARRRKEKNN